MVQLEDTVFAPLYWGFVAAVFLTGVTVVQAYVYFQRSHNDGALVRWTAACMLIMDLASTALLAQSVYYYLIPDFGSFEPLGALTPELSVDCLISTVLTFISQLYFVHQLVAVRKTGKGSWVAIWVTLISAILGFVGGVGCVASMLKFHKNVLSNDTRSLMFKILFSQAKGWAAVADIVATVAMCLWLTNSKAGIKQTNNVLSQLMVFFLQRGILVTAVQILLLITFWAAPNSLAWFALHMEVTKLYANTFFAMLNGRDNLREQQSSTYISGGYHSGANQIGSAGFGYSDPVRSGNRQPIQDGGTYNLDKMGSPIYPTESKESDTSPVQHPYAQKMPTITRTVVVSDV